MLVRRCALLAMLMAVIALPLVAQAPGGGGKAKSRPNSDLSAGKDSIQCPYEDCGKDISFDIKNPPTTCPNCQKKIEITKKDDGDGYTIKGTQANAATKWLLIGGGSVIGLALLWFVLSNTVFAKAKPKKKKKRRDDDDEDEDEDDRPRRKRRDVEDSDDDEPRRKPKRPRDDDDD